VICFEIKPKFDGAPTTDFLPIAQLCQNCIYVVDILVAQMTESQIRVDCQMNIGSWDWPGKILWEGQGHIAGG